MKQHEIMTLTILLFLLAGCAETPNPVIAAFEECNQHLDEVIRIAKSFKEGEVSKEDAESQLKVVYGKFDESHGELRSLYDNKGTEERDAASDISEEFGKKQDEVLRATLTNGLIAPLIVRRDVLSELEEQGVFTSEQNPARAIGPWTRRAPQ